jgi:formylglycine-generating enzyme required for sulfatase activity
VRAPPGYEILDATPRFERWAGRIRDHRTGAEFVLIEPGSFMMGSPATEPRRRSNERQHRVWITHPFYLAVTETTVGQWRRFVKETGYVTDVERSGSANAAAPDDAWNQHPWWNPIPSRSGDWSDEHPVTQVSWNDACLYCRHWGYRLPTEAEWEFAARAGSTGAYWWGDDPADGVGRGNFADTTTTGADGGDNVFPFSDGFALTSPVASFKANPVGLQDILGGVWEWCRDGYIEDPSTLAPKDPECVEGSDCVLRGGSFRDGSANTRLAVRSRSPASTCSYLLGFRPAVYITS